MCIRDRDAYAPEAAVLSLDVLGEGQAILPCIFPVSYTHLVQVGRWEKPHPTHPLKLYTETGEEMTLNRGRTCLLYTSHREQPQGCHCRSR